MRVVLILSFVGIATAGQSMGYDYQLGESGSVEEGLIGGQRSEQDTSANYGGEALSRYSGLHTQVFDGSLNKEYYLYSAPEQDFQNNERTKKILSSLKRNLRVVFIKSPENNGIANAALQLAKQASEDRTAIFVLSKHTDISELANQVQELKDTVRQKPEVRFVKYRNDEDAVNTQRLIQQQYDALIGKSRTYNEGIAPVIDFGSDLGESNSASSISTSGLIGNGAMREYLPSIVY